ncbi:hypothetical protein BDV29DRAFT_177238 [Aspergillus leporis]|uniref:Uncharacterized protein n=1 Tax=Aspergillus leporis TaxID=41062 RepID=A0A5N5WXW2_9EURO|nr:hypothetical protein BDV29DRAFT_177238 [Aspergillus leporis]
MHTPPGYPNIQHSSNSKSKAGNPFTSPQTKSPTKRTLQSTIVVAFNLPHQFPVPTLWKSPIQSNMISAPIPS